MKGNMSACGRINTSWLGIGSVVAMLVLAPQGAMGSSLVACAGDCDGDGQVTVPEIVAVVNAALGQGPMPCGTVDTDGDGIVQVPDLIAIVNLALHGCPAPFDYAATTTEPFRLLVRVDGDPAPNVRVLLTDAMGLPPDGVAVEEVTSANVYFQGVTDAEGRVEAPVKIPTRFDAVDLVLTAPDTTGPYTVEGLRELWGPFAPAARVTVVRGFLDDVVIDLRRAD